VFVPRSAGDVGKLLAGLVLWPATIGVRGGQVHVMALQETAGGA